VSHVPALCEISKRDYSEIRVYTTATLVFYLLDYLNVSSCRNSVDMDINCTQSYVTVVLCISGVALTISLYVIMSLVIRRRRRARLLQLDDVMKVLCFPGNKRRLSGRPPVSSDVALTTGLDQQLISGADGQMVLRTQTTMETGIMLENSRYASASSIINVKGSDHFFADYNLLQLTSVTNNIELIDVNESRPRLIVYRVRHYEYAFSGV
jgi:hypothetical protein